MIEQTLHGLVVGIGKIRKDGSKEFHWLDKPIHNRIVSGGLDEYFMFNGSTTSGPSYAYDAYYMANRFLPYGYQTMGTTGLLQFIAIGTDGTPTNFTDSNLKAQVGGYSRVLPYNTIPYFGTRRNADNSISIRVPRASIAVDSDTVVREIGWFEKYTESDTYVMFSRVVLPSPIELAVGERLTVVYQLNISYGNLEEAETPQSTLSGLLDSDGNPLRGRSSYRLYFTTNRTSGSPPNIGTWFNANTGDSAPGGTFFGIMDYYYYQTYVYGNLPKAGKGYELHAPFETLDSGQGDAMLAYTLDSNWSIRENCSYMPSSQSSAQGYLTQSKANITSANPKPYVPGTYYRDREIVVAPAWPNMNDGYQDIYAICHNSYLTRFGYMDTTDPDNPVWVPKPWRKQFGQSYKFTFRYKLSTADTV